MSIAKYFSFFKNDWQIALFYRANLIFNFFVSFISLIVVFYLWNDIYSGKAMVMGYSKDQIITYYLLTIFLMSSIKPGLWVSSDIREGYLSISLAKPFNYIWAIFFQSLADRVMRMLIGLPIVIVLFVVLRKYLYIVTDFKSYLFFIITVLLAIIILFLLDLLICFLEFWIVHSDSLFFIFDGVQAFLGGAVLPLFFFPSFLQKIADFLPFKYTSFFLVNSFLGRISQSEILFGIGIQFLWIIILSILISIVWKKGLKKYEAFGG